MISSLNLWLRSLRRMTVLPIIPTRRAYLLFLLGLAITTGYAIYGSERQLALIGLALLGFDALLLAVIFVDGQRVRLQQVQVYRHPLEKLSIGRDNPVILTLAAEKPATVQVRDAYPPSFSVSTPILTAALPSHAPQDLTYTIRPTQRGEYQWGAMQVRQLSPWGLTWHDWRVEQPQTVAVYPDLVGLRSLSIRLTLQSTGVIRQARNIGIGTEFAELRDYATGDDPRLIDWKATARRHRLLIRVLEPEQEQTLLILLDRGRLMTAQVEGLARFDWGLNATLSLAMAGIRRGDRVGVAVFDRQIHTLIPPQRGQHHFSRLLERLTPIQPELLEPDYMGAVTTLLNQQSRRALVVLITDIVDATASAELLGAMGRLAPRYLPFCVTLRDPQVDRQAHTSTLEVTAAYSRAVALDLLTQRQVAFALLRRKGVLVLDAPASQIAQQVVDEYLNIKARNRL
jgi:uncharacterized protein (DUF58 family)